MNITKNTTVRRIATVVVCGAFGLASGMLAVDAAGAANAPTPDGSGSINGVVPVVDSTGELRRDAQGNLVGIRVADMLPDPKSPASASAAGVRREVREEKRTGPDGVTRTVKVEEVITTALDPEASLAKRRLVSIPDTSRLGR